jgi:hypothetical protein
MGRAWAPAVASIFMAEWDQKFLQSLAFKPVIYRRYIDDIFCIFNDRAHAVVADSIIDGISPNIRAGERNIATDVNFLDIRLRIISSAMRAVPVYQFSTTAYNNGMKHELNMPTRSGPMRVHISLYRKATDLMCLLHHGSAHTRSLKLNVLFGQLIRIFRVSNDNYIAGWHMRQLVDTQIRFRDLSLRDGRTVWSRVLDWVARNCRTSQNVSACNSDNNRNVRRRATCRTLLRLPFNEKQSALRNHLARVYCMLSNAERECIGDFAVAYRPPASLQRLLF